jgi:hypothetical protein
MSHDYKTAAAELVERAKALGCDDVAVASVLVAYAVALLQDSDVKTRRELAAKLRGHVAFLEYEDGFSDALRRRPLH